MKLWEKGYQLDQLIEDFTTKEDRKLDLLLAKYDVEGSVAHARMLNSIGYIDQVELSALTKELAKISGLIDKGKFTIEDGVEDVHSQVELLLVKALGDTGKKIHLGRSRNDQVLVDLRLFFLDKLSVLQSKIIDLSEKLLELSEKHKDDLIPGYTHMQVAMVSSFGLWYGAYAESLLEDAEFTKNVQNQINKKPTWDSSWLRLFDTYRSNENNRRIGLFGSVCQFPFCSNGKRKNRIIGELCD